MWRSLVSSFAVQQSILAIRLERAGVSTARAWLMMQANYDLAHAMHREQPAVRTLQELPEL